MSLAISLKSEFSKTKRSPVWILTLVMAAFVPIFMLLVFKEVQDGQPSDDVKRFAKGAWDFYYYQGIGMNSFLFLPMFIVLISTLLPQIEYRNNTWKQVLASPQSFGKLYLSKFLILQLFIVVFIVASLLFIGLSGVFSNMLNPKFHFYDHPLNWEKMLKMITKSYISILALSAIQFWMGLRFKSFLLPIGVGVLCYILGMINMIGYKIIDPSLFPFNFSGYIIIKEHLAKVHDVLWLSGAYMIGVLGLGFLDFRFKKWD